MSPSHSLAVSILPEDVIPPEDLPELLFAPEEPEPLIIPEVLPVPDPQVLQPGGGQEVYTMHGDMMIATQIAMIIYTIFNQRGDDLRSTVWNDIDVDVIKWIKQCLGIPADVLMSLSSSMQNENVIGFNSLQSTPGVAGNPMFIINVPSGTFTVNWTEFLDDVDCFPDIDDYDEITYQLDLYDDYPWLFYSSLSDEDIQKMTLEERVITRTTRPWMLTPYVQEGPAFQLTFK